MVKSKKMSKSTIAVIVLAILLALSLILGMSGAWFTDSDKNTNSGTVQFGNVKVTAGDPVTVTAKSGCDLAHFQPGCALTVSSAKLTNAGDVSEYILYTYVYSIKSGENDLTAAVTAKDGDVKILTYTAPTAYDQYLVAAGSEVTVPSLEIKLNEATGNYAYDKAAKVRYVLNKGTDYAPLSAEDTGAGWSEVDLSAADVTISVTIKAYAIQETHLALAEYKAWAQAKVDADLGAGVWQDIAAYPVAPTAG